MANNEFTKQDIISLANQMIMLQESIEDEHLKKVFKEIDIIDYTLLKKIYNNVSEEHVNEPIYLKVLAPQLNTAPNRVSRITQHLQEQGYIYWEHDDAGTYIRLSETGLAKMKKQQDLLGEYYYNVVSKMGYLRFIRLIDAMTEYRKALNEEADKL